MWASDRAFRAWGGSPTFTAKLGYTGNYLSALINTGYNYSTNGVNFKQNSASLLGWSTQGTTTDWCMIGESDASYNDYLYAYNPTPYEGGALNGIAGGITQSIGTGLSAIEVTGSTTVTAYRNGTSIGTFTGTTGAPSNATAVGLSCNSSIFFGSNAAMIAVAATLGATAQANVYSRIHTFLHTVNPTTFP
ncbi:MAG: hypothetical protein P4M05_27445 [Bradyrhizobium sp.]|nr:hypothetical protein [Bradyrhizobium sp.]